MGNNIHMLTIFKLAQLPAENEKVLVLIPDKIVVEEIKDGKVMVGEKTYSRVLDAYKNGEEYGYGLEVFCENIFSNGAAALADCCDYEDGELEDPQNLFEEYTAAYLEELGEMVWFLDFKEIIPTLDYATKEAFFERFHYSIDYKAKKLVSSENAKINEQIEEDETIAQPISRLSLISYLKERFFAQDEQINKIVSAVYNPIKLSTPKRNIMLYGPTGVGKTGIVKALAKRLGLPFYKADMSSYSASGYVGASIEDIYSGLYLAAGEDIEVLKKGAVLFLDEIDKLLISDKTDVKSQVYNELLTLLEPGGVVNIKYGKGSLEEIFEYDKRNLIIISSGSFAGLDRNKSKKEIGFGSESKETVSKHTIKELNAYGIPMEFLGRQGLIIGLNKLSEKDLFEILAGALESPYMIYKKRLETLGINLNIPESTLKLLAKKAYSLNTGARSLNAIFENAFEPEINGVVDKIDNGEAVTDLKLDIPEETLVKRLERING